MTDKELKEEFENIKNEKYTENDYDAAVKQEEYVNSLASKGPLSESIDNIKDLFGMLKDRKRLLLAPATLAVITGTLMYVISPLDLIPDFIPLVGLLDDAAIIAATVGFISGDIKKYKEQKDGNSGKKTLGQDEENPA